MQKDITLRLKPQEVQHAGVIADSIAQTLGKMPNAIKGYYITKQSIDARSKHQIWVNLSVKVFIDEPLQPREQIAIPYQQVPPSAKKVIIIGAGPAGLFAALQLIEQGIQPILLERGKPVRERRRDLATMNKTGVVDADSNYCFGEGGAGTYSDGKLYTRSNKRGDIQRILALFVQFGAEENILYQSHPHIGTNKLPNIITAMREKIEACGGAVHFNQRVVDFIISNNRIQSVITDKGEAFTGDAVILATGHSARDIFQLLYNKEILIEAKPFALGVRVEHPQQLIDSIQYHQKERGDYLPPAAYSAVEQIDHRGVFSFCMCPGGIIAPAATDACEIVVNGWSPSKRNNPYANSGIVVAVSLLDAVHHLKEKMAMEYTHPLALLYFQKSVEQMAFTIGGGDLKAPSQRLVDFCEDKLSDNFPNCSYIPGIVSADVGAVLPPFIAKGLREAFKVFGKKMRGYYTNEAVVVATESRTSSPVRIPRDEITLQHPTISNLYPCGEGAGYAGGIVSAAMDGENVAKCIAQQIQTQ